MISRHLGTRAWLSDFPTTRSGAMRATFVFPGERTFHTEAVASFCEANREQTAHYEVAA